MLNEIKGLILIRKRYFGLFIEAMHLQRNGIVYLQLHRFHKCLKESFPLYPHSGFIWINNEPILLDTDTLPCFYNSSNYFIERINSFQMK